MSISAPPGVVSEVLLTEQQIQERVCALGAAMAGAVVAGEAAGGHATFASAARAMTGVLAKRFRPRPAAVRTYERLYGLYKRLHDSFGTRTYAKNQFDVMKELLNLRDQVRAR